MSKEEKNLIINSSICDKDDKLKEILSLFKGRIEKRFLDKIEEIDDEVYKIIITRDAVEEIIKVASLEWYQHAYQGKIKKPCELCGSSKSEEKFIIINRINDNKLSVGSSCIFKFPQMEKTLHGIPITTFAKLSKNNPKRLKRIVEFNELYGSGINIFTEWRNAIIAFDIIFPKNYDKDFNNILKRGKKIYDSYIDGIINYEELKGFKACMIDFEYHYKKCRKFYDDKKDNKYICTKKIANLLEKNNLKETLEYIREKEEITKDIAKYVYHIEFVERFKADITYAFNKYNIELKSLNDQYVRFFYKYKNFEPIILESSLRNFTMNFSDIFYGINSFSENDVFNKLNIKNVYNNVYNFLGILDYILKTKGYYFYINEELYGKQTIELNRKGFKKFATLDLKNILNSYNEVLYLNEEISKKILLDYIGNIDINKWVDNTDKEKYDIGNIAEVWSKEI